MSEYFALFLKSISMFNISEKAMTLRAYLFPKLRTAKDVVRQMSKNPCFTTPFGSQHAEGFETLLKS